MKNSQKIFAGQSWKKTSMELNWASKLAHIHNPSNPEEEGRPLSLRTDWST